MAELLVRSLVGFELPVSESDSKLLDKYNLIMQKETFSQRNNFHIYQLKKDL